MRRAAVSVPSNIAEGQVRGHAKVFREFLKVAMDPVSELETQIDLSISLEMVLERESQKAMELCKEA